MIKAYCVNKYLSDAAIRKIADSAEKYGYDMTFYNSPEEATGKVSDGEVIFCTNPVLLAEMPDLKWCHTASAGADKFIGTGLFGTSEDSGRAVLTNSSGAYGRAISEHVIMVSLMLLRRIPEYEKMIDDREWKQHLPVRSIAGSNIAIIGTGDIGSTAAKKFKALGAGKVIGFSRSGRAKEPFDEVYKLDDFTAVIGPGSYGVKAPGSGCGSEEAERREAACTLPHFTPDIVVMCIPKTPETDGIFDEEKIKVLPETAYFINVGRGTTVDQDALVRALNEGRIAGAALDVVRTEPLPQDDPLWTTRNLILTPHTSGDMGLEYTNDVTAEFFCENLRRYAEGEKLINIVDPAAGY
ncbi:MAG: D-2-hydroxyacid dehydrogenase [Mogibacterium sp.]|nr:D-2-hydroxyacid dehydrogenase [Mogibacterium sp.]